MNKPPFVNILLLIAVLFAAIPESAVTEKLTIMASTTQIADFARQIVLGADLCMENGLHLEGKNWMATLSKDANKPLITTTDGIKPLQLNEGGQLISDPQAWFPPQNVAVYVRNIVKGIVRLDPANKNEYHSLFC